MKEAVAIRVHNQNRDSPLFDHLRTLTETLHRSVAGEIVQLLVTFHRVCDQWMLCRLFDLHSVHLQDGMLFCHRKVRLEK